MAFYQALISATSEAEAEKILERLVKNRLVAGGLITRGKSLYWWNKKPVQRVYWNLSAFTTSEKTKQIISAVKKIHADKVPIIAFFKIETGNQDFLRWIEENVGSRSS